MKNNAHIQHIYNFTYLLIFGEGMSLFHLTFQFLLQLRYLTLQLFYLVTESLFCFCLRPLQDALMKGH